MRVIIPVISILCGLALSAGAPCAERVLHRGGIGDPETLDPQATGSGTEGTLMTDLFSGLLTPGPAGDIVLGTAESWSVSEDGKTYLFRLRDGLKWSDGTPLTADDYLYGIRRLMDPATAASAASFLYSIVNAEAVNRGNLPTEALGVRKLDQRTLQVRTSAPTPYLPEMLAVIWDPAPRHVIEKYGAAWTRPGRHVSNGPFKLAEWIPNQHVKVFKNKHFHDADNVKLDAVIHYPAEDIATSMKRFRAGELDIVTAFPTQQLDWVRDNLPAALHITPTINLEAYLFNTSRAPLDDSRVRLALSMAINRELLVEKILRGGELPAYGIVPPAASHYPQHARAAFADLPYSQRLQRARGLLADAGFSADQPLQVELRLNASEIRRQIALATVSMWKQIGVQTTLLATEDKARLRDIRTGNYQIAASLRLSASADPYVFMQPFHSQAGPTNTTRYASEAFDRWLDSAAGTADLRRRADLLQNAEAELLAAQPMAPLYFYAAKKLISPRVQGWIDNPKGINPARYLSLAD
jgi:oligopeptide transport system substrate-binding protein